MIARGNAYCIAPPKIPHVGRIPDPRRTAGPAVQESTNSEQADEGVGLRTGVRPTKVDPREKKGWSYTREGKREPGEVLTTSDPHLTLSLNEIFAELAESVEDE